MMELDHEAPFDAVAVDPASRPNLDDQLSAQTDHWDESDRKCSMQAAGNHWKKIAVVLVLLLTAIVVASADYIFPSSRESKEDESAPPRPVVSRAEMESIVSEISDPLAFLDPFSAQAKALDWLVDTDTLPIDSLENFKQRYALMVFFYATNGDGWTMVETWDTLVGQNECRFSGIDCDSENHVVNLAMVAQRLSGTIPKEVGALSHLQLLSLGRNDLKGSIPSSIFAGCQKLTQLDLGHNHLSSTLSTEIGNLVNLKRLLLSFTSISGPLPESLKNLSQLETVSLVRTNLEGPIFDFVLSWPNIVSLNVGESPFQGSIPSEIGELSLLRYFIMDGSNVKVIIPTEIGKLTNLNYLHLNAIGAHGGSIPSEIGNLEKLIHLVVDGTTFTGSIPSEVGNLSDLTYIRFRGGLFTGTLPTELSSLKNLERLDVMHNNLDGDVPAGIGNLEHLIEFAISGNKFEGPLPGTFCSIQTIEYDCTVTCDCCVCTCLACLAT